MSNLAPVRTAPDGAPWWGAQVFRLPVVDLIETLGFHTFLPWQVTSGEPSGPLTWTEVTHSDPADGVLPWTSHALYDPKGDLAPRAVHAARVAHLMATYLPDMLDTTELPDLAITGGTLTMLDGCHRLLACHLRGDKHTLVCLDGDTEPEVIGDVLGLY